MGFWNFLVPFLMFASVTFMVIRYFASNIGYDQVQDTDDDDDDSSGFMVQDLSKTAEWHTFLELRERVCVCAQLETD